jgi:ABC-type transport system involved in cytochrome bd biosynthesis fused ATPase/permease subunit
MDLTQLAPLVTQLGLPTALVIVLWLAYQKSRQQDAEQSIRREQHQAERYDKLVDGLTQLIINNTTAMQQVASVTQENCNQIEDHDKRTRPVFEAVSNIASGVSRIEVKLEKVHEAVTKRAGL